MRSQDGRRVNWPALKGTWTSNLVFALKCLCVCVCVCSPWWSSLRGAVIRAAAGAPEGCPGAETTGACQARSTRSLPWRSPSPVTSLLRPSSPAPLARWDPNPGLKKTCSVRTTTATRCCPCRYGMCSQVHGLMGGGSVLSMLLCNCWSVYVWVSVCTPGTPCWVQ